MKNPVVLFLFSALFMSTAFASARDVFVVDAEGTRYSVAKPHERFFCLDTSKFFYMASSEKLEIMPMDGLRSRDGHELLQEQWEIWLTASPLEIKKYVAPKSAVQPYSYVPFWISFSSSANAITYGEMNLLQLNYVPGTPNERKDIRILETNIKTMALDFELWGEGQIGPLRGSIRINSDIPLPGDLNSKYLEICNSVSKI